jgi:hypothetical protein
LSLNAFLCFLISDDLEVLASPASQPASQQASQSPRPEIAPILIQIAI